MAERITYQVRITPGRNTMQNTTLETETDDDLVIDDTNVVALRRFIRQISVASTTPVTGVVTAINAIADKSYPLPAI
jgi:hypothetical protein